MKKCLQMQKSNKTAWKVTKTREKITKTRECKNKSKKCSIQISGDVQEKIVAYLKTVKGLTDRAVEIISFEKFDNDNNRWEINIESATIIPTNITLVVEIKVLKICW